MMAIIAHEATERLRMGSAGEDTESTATVMRELQLLQLKRLQEFNNAKDLTCAVPIQLMPRKDPVFDFLTLSSPASSPTFRTESSLNTLHSPCRKFGSRCRLRLIAALAEHRSAVAVGR